MKAKDKARAKSNFIKSIGVNSGDFTFFSMDDWKALPKEKKTQIVQDWKISEQNLGEW